MELTELKTAWKEYDQKLEATQLLNHRLIEGMITDRSKSRLSRVQTYYTFGFILTAVWLGVCLAVLAGNPFDYSSTYEYTPIFILSLSFVSIMVLMGKAYTDLKKINFTQINLADSLRQIINAYDEPQKYLKWTVITMFSASLLFPLSFLSRKIEQTGLWPAIIDTIIPMCISLVLYFIGLKLGAFKDVHGKNFKQDLKELEELKALNRELIM